MTARAIHLQLNAVQHLCLGSTGGEERDKRGKERCCVAARTLHLQLNAVRHACLGSVGGEG